MGLCKGNKRPLREVHLPWGVAVVWHSQGLKFTAAPSVGGVDDYIRDSVRGIPPALEKGGDIWR